MQETLKSFSGSSLSGVRILIFDNLTVEQIHIDELFFKGKLAIIIHTILIGEFFDHTEFIVQVEKFWDEDKLYGILDSDFVLANLFKAFWIVMRKSKITFLIEIFYLHQVKDFHNDP